MSFRCTTRTRAGQLSHHEGCMQLIREEEQSSGSFDEVILARADLTVYRPMLPYCMFEHAQPRRFADWYYHVPRREADNLFSRLYHEFYGCLRNLGLGETIEQYQRHALHSVMDDKSLPLLVTRLDQPDMPNNFCGMFRLGSAASEADRVDPLERCAAMTYQNPFNRLPSVLDTEEDHDKPT
eukprot:gb/GFBE01017935.1/.p1 GENE.gb/GFBE01017935.1/~~gb/GFBE01017935.1/.p1  ORF type:complete len:182 (+),score=23.59 gb/GFBE01017935.1/:1-546(+)